MGIFQKIMEKRMLDSNSLATTLTAMLGTEKITETEAMNIPSLAACVEFISSKVAELPIKLYCECGNETQELTDDKRVSLLNDSTGDLLDCYQLKKAVIRDYLLFGNGYIYPERRRNQFVSLRYVKQNQVHCVKNSDPIFKKADFMIYDRKFRDDEIIRILRSSTDGVTGTGIIDEANELLTVIYKTMIFEKYLVVNGGNKKGFLKSARKLSDEAMENLRKAWSKLYSNNGNNMMLLNDGIDFKESSNTSVEMQLNENKKANNDYVCEIFNLSPSVVAGMATDESYTTAIKTAVMPVIRAFETALNQGLLLESERHKHYFAFDTTELLKGDILKRYQAYQIGLANNFLQADEVRYKEDLKPLGFNFIRLGLQDVLLDPKTNMIYTPNTNQTTMFGQSVNQQIADSMNENESRDCTKVKCVWGAPLSGKSTYVLNHAGKNDIVWDWDKIKQSVGLIGLHEDNNKPLSSILFKLRSTFLRNMTDVGADTVWFICTRPDNYIKKLLGDDVEYIKLDITKDECYKRLEKDSTRQNKDKMAKLIELFFDKEAEQRWDGQPRDSNGRFDKGKKRRTFHTKITRKSKEKSSKALEKADKGDIIKATQKPSKVQKTSSNIPKVSAKGRNEFTVKGFKNKQALNNHWTNGRTHRDEYIQDGITTAEQYQARALQLVQSSADGKKIFGYKNSLGQIIRYDVDKNDFVKGNPKKGIFTMFKPEKGKKYFDEKLKEEGIQDD